MKVFLSILSHGIRHSDATANRIARIVLLWKAVAAYFVAANAKPDTTTIASMIHVACFLSIELSHLTSRARADCAGERGASLPSVSWAATFSTFEVSLNTGAVAANPSSIFRESGRRFVRGDAVRRDDRERARLFLALADAGSASTRDSP
eukprot:2317462-Rhodomonas_salina.2